MSLDLTQEELAEELSVTHSVIGHWERAEHWPEMDQLIAVANEFGVAIDDLFDRTPAKPAQGTVIVPETTRKRAPKRPKKPAKKRVRKKK